MRVFLIVTFLQIVATGEGYTCGSLGRACISSNEYITCISVDRQYIATTGLTITCPEGQMCKEDTTYPCVDDPDASSINSATCGPLGRKCLSSNEYITCISVDGEYIATTGQVITCLAGQVCREDTTYPCIDDPDATTLSPTASCGPLGTKCISSNEYITCISVDGKYIATTGQVITCLAGQVCRENTTYPCVDDPSATTSSTTKSTPTTTKSIPTTTKATPTTTKSIPIITKSTPTPTKLTPTSNKPTTTVEAIPTEPTCTEESTSPGPQCNQYYHCFAVLWWFSLEILTCPEGQAYDDTSGQCVASSTCIV